MKHFLDTCKREGKKFGSLPFWSWNDRLEEEELRAQIRRMKELGMGGFFMHARGGLKTDYLSDEWFSCINACIDEAKQQGMQAWAYDENGWPSGFAGGKLLTDPQNCMAGLCCTEENSYPQDKTDLMGVYALNEGRAVRLFGAAADTTTYYVIRRTRSNSYVDTMNPAVTAQFIALTHEKYKEKIAAEDFGTNMPGFFTDEPQYNRWEVPYSDLLPKAFYEAYGYDILDNMPALFYNCEGYHEYRYDYYMLCSRLFIENFMKPLYEWCDKNHCRLTGHGIEERSLFWQVMCCGSVMPVYEYEHIPGIDYLGRAANDDLSGRQLGSVCAQLGKKQALSEMFACCGWDVSPRELKQVADTQYVHGVNLLCQHLYPYSEHGQRKRDYPAHYSKHLPWQNELRRFNDHFAGLGCLLSQGAEEADVLVIHPIHASYMAYRHGHEQEMQEAIEGRFMAMVNELAEAGLPYHFGEESMLMRHAKVVGDAIQVGLCTYHYVLLPEMDSIDESTVALLQKYLAAGGKLCLYGKAPTRINARKTDRLATMQGNLSFATLLATSPVQFTFLEKNNSRIRQMVRQTEAGRLIFITNISSSPCRLKLVSHGSCGLTEIEPATFATRPQAGHITAEGFETTLTFADSQSYVFLESERNDAAIEIKCPTQTIRLADNFRLCERPRNALVIDRFTSKREGEAERPLQPIEQIRDELLYDRYRGNLTISATLTIDEMPASLHLATELPNGTTLTVNGKAITVTTCPGYEKDLTTADILPLVQIGENTITYTISFYQKDSVYYALYESTSESLRNCLVYDSEIECLYLFGDFTVKTEKEAWQIVSPVARRYSGSLAIGGPKETISLTDVTQNGYPFFAGSLKVETVLPYHPGDPTVLKIDGRYATCGVEVNGIVVTTLLFAHTVDLTPYLREGDNTLRLTLTNSCRNLLGPHHRKEAEPWSVGPSSFSFVKEWHNGQCDAFVPAPAFVRFGIDLF